MNIGLSTRVLIERRRDVKTATEYPEEKSSKKIKLTD